MECQCSGIYEFENGIDKLFGGSNFNKMDSVYFFNRQGKLIIIFIIVKSAVQSISDRFLQIIWFIKN
ncbi:hypothetical protein BSQ40_24755 [Serratia fonticola]|nr:hypothetical protein BSQ40_24755 [Serratia fonticola]